MSIRTVCRDCGKGVKADEKYAGKSAKCPGCGGTLLFPLKLPEASSENELPPPSKVIKTGDKFFNRLGVTLDSEGVFQTNRRVLVRNGLIAVVCGILSYYFEPARVFFSVIVGIAIFMALIFIPVILAGRLAKSKGYNVPLAQVLGFFFGVFALLFYALIPDKNNSSVSRVKHVHHYHHNADVDGAFDESNES